MGVLDQLKQYSQTTDRNVAPDASTIDAMTLWIKRELQRRRAQKAKERAFSVEHPFRGSMRRLLQEGEVSPWGQWSLPYGIGRKTGLISSPYMSNEKDMREDVPIVEDPVALGFATGVPMAIGVGGAVRAANSSSAKRLGARGVAKVLARKASKSGVRATANVASRAAARSVARTAASAVEKKVLKKGLLSGLKIIGTDSVLGIGSLAGKLFLPIMVAIRNRSLAARALSGARLLGRGEFRKALQTPSKMADDFLNIGKRRLEGNVAYQDALKNKNITYATPFKAWKQWLIDSFVDPGSMFNTAAVMLNQTDELGRRAYGLKWDVLTKGLRSGYTFNNLSRNRKPSPYFTDEELKVKHPAFYAYKHPEYARQHPELVRKPRAELINKPRPELIKKPRPELINKPRAKIVNKSASVASAVPIVSTALAANANVPVFRSMGGAISGNGSLKDVGDVFTEVGRKKMGPEYQSALKGGAVSPAALTKRYAQQAVMSPAFVNELAAGARDTINADFDLGNIMGYSLANAASTSGTHAGQVLKNLYGDKRSANISMGDIQKMTAVGLYNKLMSDSSVTNDDLLSSLLRKVINSRIPANMRSAVSETSKLKSKMQLVDPILKPKVEKATGYRVPDSRYQKHLQDIRGTSPAERPSYPSAVPTALRYGGYKLPIGKDQNG